jgi:hypothetical protein
VVNATLSRILHRDHRLHFEKNKLEAKSMNSYDISDYMVCGKDVVAGWSIVVFVNIFLYLSGA